MLLEKCNVYCGKNSKLNNTLFICDNITLVIEMSIRVEILKSMFDKAYNKHLKNGNIRHFDEEFYSTFDDMYYNGLPIYIIWKR